MNNLILNNLISLSDLTLGQTGVVDSINCCPDHKIRLMELGIVPSAHITALHKSPSGDPTAYNIKHTVIALRSNDAENIKVSIPNGAEAANYG